MDGFQTLDLGLFAVGTFAAAFVTGLAGFAFGIVRGSGVAAFSGANTGRGLNRRVRPDRPGCLGMEIAPRDQVVAPRAVSDWRAIGVPIGGELLRWTPPGNLRIAVGAILVLFSLYNLIRPNLASAARAGVIADGAVGVANGVIGGATGLAGIAAVIWCSLRGWPPAEQRAVFQPSGVAVFAITALWLGGTGMISANTLTLFFIGLPVLAVGTWARLKLFGKLDDQAFRRGSANLAAVVGPQPARPGPIMPVSYSGRMHAKDSFPLALDQGIARP